MKVGSLFSGIGGFDLGLERAGMTTAWFCEQDEFCQHVLAQHWPGVPCYPDITALRGAEVEPIDVLCGGFPCQDLSYAGAGAGLAGARSGLWSEYARLIGELRPRYVVVENVSALLARGLGAVLGDLAALGYDAEWDCIPASAVGAPHRRDRIWLVAYPDGSGQHPRLARVHARQPDAERRIGDVANSNDAGRQQRRWPEPIRTAQLAVERGGEALADAHGMARPTSVTGDRERGEIPRPGSLERALGRRSGVGDQWSAEPDVGRVAHGVPARVDRLRALGNALVPQIAEWIGHRIIDHERTGGLSHAA